MWTLFLKINRQTDPELTSRSALTQKALDPNMPIV